MLFGPLIPFFVDKSTKKEIFFPSQTLQLAVLGYVTSRRSWKPGEAGRVPHETMTLRTKCTWEKTAAAESTGACVLVFQCSVTPVERLSRALGKGSPGKHAK